MFKFAKELVGVPIGCISVNTLVNRAFIGQRKGEMEGYVKATWADISKMNKLLE